MKYFLAGFVAILALAGGVFYYITTSNKVLATPEPQPAAAVEQPKPEPKPLPNIIVEAPAPQDTISGTLEVIGKAKGGWFFEGSFPVSLTDEAGTVIKTGIAATSDEWMTLDYVPFIATIDIADVPAGQYLIQLEKDNPSGEPQNDESVTIPVVVQ